MIHAKFSDLFEDATKKGTKIPQEQYKNAGAYPIVDQGQKKIAGSWDDAAGVFERVPAIVFGDHTRSIKYIDTPFFIGADGVKILCPVRCEDNPKYLYYALQAAKIPNLGYSRHFKILKELVIPMYPRERQNEIVAKLELIDALMEKLQNEQRCLDELAKSRFVEMFGDPENNPKHWAKAPLSSVISNANNGMARRGNDTEGSIVLRLVELQKGFIDYSSPNRILLTDIEKQRYLLKDKDFLFARVNGNPENVGRCAEFSDIGEPVYHNDHIIRVHFNEKLINGCFSSALLNSAYGKKQMATQIKTSAGQYTINQEGIGAIVTILPPLELQTQFAAFVAEVDKSKLAVKQSLEKLETLKKSLMQQYFG